LFDANAADLLTFGGVAARLIVTAFAASYAPARRATRIDPAITLRSEESRQTLSVFLQRS
jgi:putative ABC transport system permease protein